jgi:hypothetical protein
MIIEQHDEYSIILVYIFTGLLPCRRARDELLNDLGIWYLKFSVRFTKIVNEGDPTLITTAHSFSNSLSRVTLHRDIQHDQHSFITPPDNFIGWLGSPPNLFSGIFFPPEQF